MEKKKLRIYFIFKYEIITLSLLIFYFYIEQEVHEYSVLNKRSMNILY